MQRWFYLNLLLLSGAGFCCDLNSPVPIEVNIPTVQDVHTPRKVLLSNNVQLQVPQADGVLKMHSADTLALLDEVSSWPTLTSSIGRIQAQPIAIDLNYDGLADAVYSIDITGLLWFVPLSAQGFASPVLVADFSQTQATFNQPLQLAQITTPDSNGVMRRQIMLLVIARTSAGDILIAVKHQAGQITPWQLTDLSDRTNLTADEPLYGIDELLWSQIQQGGGWFMRLNQRITATPQVYAGVVYLTSAPAAVVNTDCSIAPGANLALHAVHLHHAGLIYANRSWLLNTTDAGKLVLKKNQQGELALSLQNAQLSQTLLTELLAINADCADCVDELSQTEFLQLIRLATFQTEHGAH